MSTPRAAVEVFTDGACSGNPGPGGWAWATSPDGARRGSGGEAHTTNQRMEILAALEALRSLDGPLTIVSDSTYVINGCTTWWKKWKGNGWINSQRKPVVNIDLWQPLIELVIARSPKFRWVKGHSADPMNDLVDALAVAASKGPFAPLVVAPRPDPEPQGSLFE
ncbi:MAG: ribonuclease H [Ilumatobacteraceae bacterium]